MKKNKDGLKKLALDIWNNPEIAWQEKFASNAARDFLEKLGFPVEIGCFGVETAFKSESGNGNGPVFAVAAEYDALPDENSSNPPEI